MLAVRSVLNEQLTHIKDNLIKLGSLTETAVFDAMNALDRQDISLAQRVVRGDEEINQLCLDLKQQCLNVLATQHPKASDLRLVLATINMVTDLERIGD
ncbi:MAG: phosphate transport system regulator PhoU, partial [Anaerolineales bacterium]|nr:phosphate transport system regulator PhoU [Anaerolineales bacterium]